jgi:hypothetical protein
MSAEGLGLRPAAGADLTRTGGILFSLQDMLSMSLDEAASEDKSAPPLPYAVHEAKKPAIDLKARLGGAAAPLKIASPPGVSPGIPSPPFAPRPASMPESKPSASMQHIRIGMAPPQAQPRRRPAFRILAFLLLLVLIAIVVALLRR